MEIKLIQEISTKELQTSTERAFGDSRELKKAAGMSTGPIVYTIVDEGSNTNLLCTTKVMNSKSKSTNTCTVLIEGLKVIDEEGVFLATTSGGVMIEPLSANDDIKVRCTCMDFRFRFADVNANNDGLYGKRPPVYVRKTDTRPPVNPSSAPGLCKHLYKFIDVLEDEGVINR